MRLEELTQAHFSGLVGQTFAIGPEEFGPLAMVLVEVSLLPARPRQGSRQPFSLVFRGPRSPWLPQRIHPVRHETLGALEIFLVPLGPDKEGMAYQAIFN